MAVCPTAATRQTPPDVSVSVVSYNTRALLARCLASLAAERDCSGLRLDVTVVDNASEDRSADMVAADFPWVRLIRNRRNVGFGRAHNQALRGATAPYLLVLNSDAALQPGALGALAGYLDDHPDVAVAGPRLRYPNGRTQPSRRRFPTAATYFLESTQVQRLWPDNRVLRRYFLADSMDDAPQQVDWLVGACLCIRARAAQEVGLFDERFFLYSEEMDWCRRFRAAGWQVAYVPSAEVQHLEGGSSRRDPIAREIQFQAGKLRYVSKWHGPRLAGFLRAYLLGEYLARGAEEGIKLALGSQAAERRTRLRVIGAYLRRALAGR